jgi:hypothetical protein
MRDDDGGGDETDSTGGFVEWLMPDFSLTGDRGYCSNHRPQGKPS